MVIFGRQVYGAARTTPRRGRACPDWS